MRRKLISVITLAIILTNMFTLSYSAVIISDENQNPAEEGEVNRTKFVIGVNKIIPNAYRSLRDLTIMDGGKIIDKVSIEGKVIALVVELPVKTSPSITARMKSTSLATYIKPPQRFEASFIPNDANWSTQWGPEKIKADWAWNYTTGSEDVLVAVIDSGIDWDHPDIAANYDSSGYDWVNNDTDTMDDLGHGTHCAGIIAAVTNNSEGIAGLAQVRVMAEKSINNHSWGYDYWIANGIINATDCGADIISMSFSSEYYNELIHVAIKYAYNHSVLLIASAGNKASTFRAYPAAYDEVIAIAATDSNDDPAKWSYQQGSNLGNWIELAAPGDEIYSTMWDDTYTNMSGTSMATPHVVGVAALIMSRYPNITSGSVRHWLRYTADDLGLSGFDMDYGYGRINAKSATEIDQPISDLVALSLNASSSVQANTSTELEAIVFNFGTDVNYTDVKVQLLENGTLYENATIGSLPVGHSSVVNFSWTPSTGTYNLSLKVAVQLGEVNSSNNLYSKNVIARFPTVLNVPSSFSSIRAALRDAISGDTINVSAGTYNKVIVMDKANIKLIGEGNGSTTIKGRGLGPVINVEADNVTVVGFNINGTIAWKARAPDPPMPFGSIAGVYTDGTSNVNISSNNFGKAIQGIEILNSDKAVIEDNYLSNLEMNGIFGENLSYSVISGNTITDLKVQLPATIDLKFGLNLHNSTRNNVTNNDLVKNQHGLYLQTGSNNLISTNNVSNNQLGGIYLYKGCNDTLNGNFVNDNGWEPESSIRYMEGLFHLFGISLMLTNSSTLRDNSMSNNSVNFEVNGQASAGQILEHYVHDIDISNSVNHRPIYYWVNEHDEEVPWRVGFVALVNCSNILVEGLTLQRNHEGIILVHTTNSQILDNEIRYNNDGIFLINSSHNIIAGNNIYDHNDTGIHLFGSSYNEIFHNTISRSDPWMSGPESALYFYYSSNNTISHNSIDFYLGVYPRVSIVGSVNVWDLGYPLGGNYWDDYDGDDNYSGPYQNESGWDGIGDTPYVIDDYNNDSYPKIAAMGNNIQRDVAILNVTANSTVVALGKSTSISVEGKNQGHHFTEVLNVTTYAYNTTEELNYTIGTLNTTLLPLSNDTLTFNWNTTGVTSNVTYTIKAEATVVPYETDTTDNTYVDGTVFIRSYNNPPQTPLTPDGPTPIYTGQSKNYNSTASDPDSDQVWYEFDWDDDTTTEIGPYGSNVTGYYAAHTWVSSGIYDVKVRARDIFHDYSNWSDSHAVTVNHAGGCPFVYVWNGTEFVIDNNLVTGSAKSNGTEVEDYYRLEQDLVPLFEGYFNSYYSLKISEFQQEHSYFDQVQLFAVDHQANVSVAASSTGEILTYQDPYPPITAVDEANVSWLAELSEIDGEYYEGYDGSFLVLNFGEVTGQTAKLVFQTDPPPPGDTKTSIYIQVLNSSESWVDVVSIIPRTYWATDIIDLSDYLLSDGELVVRFYFTFNHRVGFVGLDTTPQAEIDVEDANLLLAYHSEEGFVTAELRNDDDVYAELVPDQQITLLFSAAKPDGEARTFIFYVKGYYYTLTS